MGTVTDDLSSALIRSVANLQEEEALKLVQQRVSRNDDPMDIVEDCRQGMVLVGQRYEQRQYFLSGLILAGEILREVTEIVQPLTEKKYSGKSFGLILLGTVKGDIHDAGKDLFQIMLTVHGFTVYDLGVDVPPADFLAKALELKPAVIGLSCLLVGAFPAMKATIALLHAEPQLKNTPVIIGGQVTEDVCQFVGADHWSMDAMDGVRWCQDWVATHKTDPI
ncbi:MAG: cobalamin-dependent protein [Anaerolineaceae bacterium]